MTSEVSPKERIKFLLGLRSRIDCFGVCIYDSERIENSGQWSMFERETTERRTNSSIGFESK